MTPSEREDQFVDELSILPDAFERMSYLVEIDKRRPALDDSARTNDRLVPGCQAQVWIVAENDHGRWQFSSDSDAPMVRALAGALCGIFSDAKAEEIADFEPSFLDRLGLRSQITPTRQNGFLRMVERIKGSI